jgi:hypothetical protein
VAIVLLKDMVLRSRRLQRNATSASLILNALAPCVAVLVMPQGLHRSVVTADSGLALLYTMWMPHHAHGTT